MSSLTKPEIETLLETRSPEWIREQEMARLDNAGLAILAEAEQDLLEADDFSKDWGKRFRDSMPAVPELILDNEDNSSSDQAGPGSPLKPDAEEVQTLQDQPRERTWWNGSKRVANPILAMAAVFIFGFASLFLLAYQGYLQSFGLGGLPNRTRGGPEDGPAIQELNETLYSALLERGSYLLDEGSREQDHQKLKEALTDLSQARELRENYAVLSKLALTYQALGNQKLADEFLDKALAFDEETER